MKHPDRNMSENDYNQLQGIATIGLNVALFGNTVSDLKNFYDIKDKNGSIDVNVVLWLLRLSFCFQVCVALLAVLMYMINKDQKNKTKKYKRLSEPEEFESERKNLFHRRKCRGLTVYQILYLTSLICILIITTLQIIASIWSASLGIELKSANKEVGPYDSHSTMNPNFTTTVENTSSTYSV